MFFLYRSTSEVHNAVTTRLDIDGPKPARFKLIAQGRDLCKHGLTLLLQTAVGDDTGGEVARNTRGSDYSTVIRSFAAYRHARRRRGHGRIPADDDEHRKESTCLRHAVMSSAELQATRRLPRVVILALTDGPETKHLGAFPCKSTMQFSSTGNCTCVHDAVMYEVGRKRRFPRRAILITIPSLLHSVLETFSGYALTFLLSQAKVDFAGALSSQCINPV